MKKILNIGALALFSFFAITACDPQESSDYALGSMPTPEQLDFTVTPTAEKANIIVFDNSSDVAGVAVWDLGNGTKTKGDEVTSQYPFKGDYTITMTLYTSGGSTFITKTITVANDDMSLLNTPGYTALTGGASDADGKTWVFDQYHAAHFGVAPFDATSPSWWTCAAEEKTESSMYFNEFTFTQIGVKFAWTNNGYVYTNANGKAALADLGYTNAVAPPAGDFDVEYAPNASYTFSLDEAAGILSLSDGAFLGHYAGTSTYQVYKLTEDELYLKCVSTVEPGNSWWYRFIPKEKNIKPVIPVKAIPLSDDFEGATPKVAFVKEAMGARTVFNYYNPAPVPINESDKVYLYQKSTDFYSNISFTASKYKFDLTTQNKITMKVYIPSYNDYTTDNAVAGSWITNAKLQNKVAVKLQDSSMGGNAWSNQEELTSTDIPTDQWVSLTFDFSLASTRVDLDKIVIQFGGEGQAGSGIFFFDDFAFGE